MKGKHETSAVCLALVTLFVGAASATAGQEPSENSSLDAPQSILRDTANDGTTVIKAMQDRTKHLKAYTFDSTLSTFVNGKEIIETGKLYFKSPNLLRFEVKRAGKRSGAVVIRQADGKIRGKMGGALGGVKLTLSPDSKLLKSSNGFSVLESDLGSLLALAVEKTSSNNCIVGKIAGIPAQLVELVEKDGDMIFRIILDSSSKWPDKWSLFKDDHLFSTLKFTSIQSLPDLPDALFTFAKAAEDTTASDRRVPMSVSEYRLQCESLKRDMLIESLKELDSSKSLNDFRLKMVENAIVNMKQDVSEISAHSVLSSTDLSAEQSTNWAPGGKERFVVKCAEMELLLSALSPLGKTSGSATGAPPSAEKIKLWNDCLSNCRSTLSKLMDEIEQDTPSLSGYERLVSDLALQVGELSDAVKLFDAEGTSKIDY
jgi:outer membrane lipoprotein-sorting protein